MLIHLLAQLTMEEKELFEKVTLLLMRYGIKSMTMDEIARQLGISKKTLYLFVDNKKDLVKKMMQLHVECEQSSMGEIFKSCDNSIDEIMVISKEVNTQMKDLHPSVMFDLKKYHPEAFQILVQHKDDFIKKCILKNLEIGVKDGWYRRNLNPEIVSRFYLSMVDVIMNSEIDFDASNSFQNVHTEMMRYHIRGIASSKGREYLKQKFNQDNV